MTPLHLGRAAPVPEQPPRSQDPVLTAWAPGPVPEVHPGDDLTLLALEALGHGPELRDGDIVVVTSKIVSKAEGRVVQADDRQAAIDSETVRLVASIPHAHDDGATLIVENRLGMVCAAAGVDASNTAAGTVLLLPVDPDESARALAAGLRDALGLAVGVIITDTLGRAWRNGQTDVAIGAAGVRVFDELAGTTDAQGRPLVATRPCLADELAGAADLVKGKASGRPFAVVRGMGHAVGALDLPGARSIVRSVESDMFRQGHREAYADGYAAGLAARDDAGTAGTDKEQP
ncbi:coenzyme F420-0:L-glutamate ligase [Demequina zhanjiangensis]|uniref:Coenzyme F420-0:L-glutamate ligase n=1 Tax=Demequina zhanjiangensis TaxID=3051659 RepID=A0ABT8FX65_9MICO|nr:coenzyme F420-0:L-glutamate ligase [Demequina sp. SYSU T00b26]MDN4471496.1 coenzyme F420-0:L-glutamate ligase [Demequina sp. SYSU T00b26]